MGSISTGAKGIAASIGALMIVSAAVAMGSSSATPPRLKAQNDPDAALCIPTETPLFTCTLGTRRASVCHAGGKATYRYGRPGRIELSSQRLTLANRGFSGGGKTQITAANNGYSYVMFDRTIRTGFGTTGQNDPKSETGLIVRQGNKQLSSRICDNDTPISSRSQKVIPTGSFVPH